MGLAQGCITADRWDSFPNWGNVSPSPLSGRIGTSPCIFGEPCQRELRGHWRGYLGFPGGSDGKDSACNAGDLGSILGWEDPVENEMATHSSILAWRIPWTEKSGGLQFIGLKRVRHGWVTIIWRGYLEGWQCLKHLKCVAISFPVSWLFALTAEIRGVPG